MLYAGPSFDCLKSFRSIGQMSIIHPLQRIEEPLVIVIELLDHRCTD
jgi:hypothetical protein